MDVNTLNVGLPLVADCFVLVLLLIAANSRRYSTRREWLPSLTVTVLFLLIVTSIKEAEYARFLDMGPLPFTGFLDYALSTGSYVFFYLYTLAYAAHRREVRKSLWFTVPLWGVAMIALFASSYATGMFFTFGADGMPRLTSTYWLTQAGVYAIGLATIAMAFAYRDVLPKTVLAVVVLYAALPLVLDMIVDTLTGLNTVYIATAIMVMVLYGFVDKEQHVYFLEAQAHLAEQQNEIINARVQAAVSQIRPHFVSNTISSIMVLCKNDPDEAVEALSDFADYLRGNLGAISTKGAIPFNQELEHVRAYMALEKRRFAEKLQVRYDIQARDFEVPVLSVQVLMENAVKHGVGQKREGGTVCLATREASNEYVIIVEDDGVGFNVPNPGLTDTPGAAAGASNETPEALTPEAAMVGNHMGLKNVRLRLENVCGGTLRIESTPGVGTTAIITVPKGGTA